MAEYYDTLEVGGQRVAKITRPYISYLILDALSASLKPKFLMQLKNKSANLSTLLNAVVGTHISVYKMKLELNFMGSGIIRAVN